MCDDPYCFVLSEKLHIETIHIFEFPYIEHTVTASMLIDTVSCLYLAYVTSVLDFMTKRILNNRRKLCFRDDII